ncbi:MAG TPA: asparagine synthase (glutamine-hydrolyzing), partial [Alphaproteobacteria bacterium]|nr:asparagine synthase (glutamine-hydrolyzing) [Alphaproteobacteria bacterium]
MCGLSGIMSLKTATDRRTLAARAQAMGDALRHRGPDDQGVWTDPDVPLALAHRRLSILDLSPEGHQPMLSPSGTYAIVFNGEIYNFAALRAELESQGAAFRGRSDTEVLLALIERDGLDATLKRIEGMFAIALWDRQARALTLIRDRMGKKPLYVGWAGGDLVFASELKGLRAHPDFDPVVDRETLAAYLRTGFVCPPRCIYRNVWSLPPGTRLTLALATLTPGESLPARMKPYWSAGDAARQAIDTRTGFASEDAAMDSFDRVFEACVSERMVADVPLGAFLSGGVDSSAVVAMMQRLSPRPVKT